MPGDENPDFKPKGGLIHMPSTAKLHADKDARGIELPGRPHMAIRIKRIHN